MLGVRLAEPAHRLDDGQPADSAQRAQPRVRDRLALAMDHLSRLVPREVVAVAVHVLHLAVSMWGFDFAFALSMNGFMPACCCAGGPGTSGVPPNPGLRVGGIHVRAHRGIGGGNFGPRRAPAMGRGAFRRVGPVARVPEQSGRLAAADPESPILRRVPELRGGALVPPSARPTSARSVRSGWRSEHSRDARGLRLSPPSPAPRSR